MSLKIILLIGALWLPSQVYAAKNILVFGDSLSAGYRIAAEQSWPSLLQQELALKYPEYLIVNASISGETLHGGRQRIGSALRQHRPAIVILELGANDGLRGFSAQEIEDNLSKLIASIQQTDARVLLVGMKLPPNYGEPYASQFEKIYPTLAQKYRVPLLPFLLEGIAPEQFQADNLHPVAAAQPLIMRHILQILNPLLR